LIIRIRFANGSTNARPKTLELRKSLTVLKNCADRHMILFVNVNHDFAVLQRGLEQDERVARKLEAADRRTCAAWVSRL